MKTLLLFALLFATVNCISQDVIIKKDQAEIKSKVVEITETAIKYKNFENLDGPVYNISKNEVFMIIYSNGQREIIQPITKSNSAAVGNARPGETSNVNSYSSNTAVSNPIIDTTVDYKKIKIKYSPTRLLYQFGDVSLNFGFEQDYRIIKNTVNIGIMEHYAAVDGASLNTYGLYISPYAAINRLTGNYAAQDKGLFLSAKAGYSISTVSFDGGSASSSDMFYGAGLDYLVTRGFGINGSAIKVGQGDFVFQAGIVFKFF